jgi:hypothetical protein
MSPIPTPSSSRAASSSSSHAQHKLKIPAPSKTLTPKRKHRKMLKDGTSEVWPENVERIFVEGECALLIRHPLHLSDLTRPFSSSQASDNTGLHPGLPSHLVAPVGATRTWLNTCKRRASSAPRSKWRRTSKSSVTCGKANPVSFQSERRHSIRALLAASASASCDACT